MRSALLVLALFLSVAFCFAADKKISELPSGSPAESADMIPIARGGLNYRLAGSDFLFNTANLTISGAPPTFALTNTATGGGTTTFTQVPSGTTVSGYPAYTWDSSVLRFVPSACEWSSFGCAGLVSDSSVSLTGTSLTYPIMRGFMSTLRYDGTLATGKSAEANGIASTSVWAGQATDSYGGNALGAAFAAIADSGSTNSYIVGAYAYADAKATSSGQNLIGMRALIDLTNTTPAFDLSTAMWATGPAINRWGTDVTKVYKFYETGYGRNYLFQPADAIGDSQYALETANGMGILATGRTGQLQLAKASGGSKPACAVGTRGSIWYEAGATDVADTLEVCRKDASNAYAWVSLY